MRPIRSICSPFFLLLSVLLACKSGTDRKPYEPTYYSDTAQKNTLLFGVPNLPYYDLHDPLIRALNRELKSFQTKMVAGSNFIDYVNKLKHGEYDWTLVSGAVALELEKGTPGYNIVAKMSGDEQYRGVVLVNRDSNIRSLADLRGRTISSPGKEALAGYKMPAYMLYENGIDLQKDVRFLWVGSFESMILNIYHGKCAAGFGWLASCEQFLSTRPALRTKVELKWTTETLPNVAVLVRKDMDPLVAQKLVDVLLRMGNDKDGLKTLKAFGGTYFEKANTETYRPVMNFIERYRIIDK